MRKATHRKTAFAASLITAAALSVGMAAAGATGAKRADQITLSMVTLANQQTAWQVLIPNFERVYPNIKVNISYAANNTQLYQLETTQLAAGNAPDILAATPGQGTPNAVSTLAKAGYLAPMIGKPWAKRLVAPVTSRDKVGKALYAYTPGIGLYGVFTNDTLFKKLGLKVPQTFQQVLDVCAKAKAAGVTAWLFGGSDQSGPLVLTMDIAVADVYAKDPHWKAEREAGKVTFAGTQGWRQSLQQFIDMNNAGCFQAGVAGTANTAALSLFAQGQGLMWFGVSGQKGALDAGNPSFTYSIRPAPVAADPKTMRSFFNPDLSLAVNAHSSADAQKAAQTFVDFIARPKQDGLYEKLLGNITQDQWRHEELPSWMSDFVPVLKANTIMGPPLTSWWNADVGIALRTNAIGLLTGQQSIDDVLNSMDKAFNKGPQ